MDRKFVYIVDEFPAIDKPPLGFISCDIETTGLDWMRDKLEGFSFSTDGKTGYYTNNNEIISKVLKTPYKKVFHNATFDLTFLKKNNYEITGEIHDTLLLAHQIDSDRPNGLKDLSKDLLGESSVVCAEAMNSWLKETYGKIDRENIAKAPQNILVGYAAEDALNTYDLFVKLVEKCKKIMAWFSKNGYAKNPWNCYIEEDLPIIPVVVSMQLAGVRLDLEKSAKTNETLRAKADELLNSLPKDKSIAAAEEILYKKVVNAKLASSKSGVLKKQPPAVKFNWESNDHLKVLFFSILKENPLKKTKKGSDCVDNSVLERLSKKYEWLEHLLAYRKIKKLLGTYVEGLFAAQYGGVVRASFHIAGTATGRFSSSNPNMQNLPRWGGIKELYIPRSGTKFIYADYSQLELRIAAHLSQDALLLKAYRDGLDLHRITAGIIFQKKEEDITDEERAKGKTVNFSIIYNAGGYRLAEILGYLKDIDPKDDQAIFAEIKRGDKIRSRLFGRYSGLKAFVDKQMDKLTRDRLAITEFGRMRRLPGLSDPNDKKMYKHWLKAGFNMPIQSFGASLCRRAMVKISSCGYQILNQIHDSIIIEHPENDLDRAAKEVQNIMETIYPLNNISLKAEPKILNSFGEVADETTQA